MNFLCYYKIMDKAEQEENKNKQIRGLFFNCISLLLKQLWNIQGGPQRMPLQRRPETLQITLT